MSLTPNNDHDEESSYQYPNIFEYMKKMFKYLAILSIITAGSIFVGAFLIDLAHTPIVLLIGPTNDLILSTGNYVFISLWILIIGMVGPFLIRYIWIGDTPSHLMVLGFSVVAFVVGWFIPFFGFFVNIISILIVCLTLAQMSWPVNPDHLIRFSAMCFLLLGIAEIGFGLVICFGNAIYGVLVLLGAEVVPIVLRLYIFHAVFSIILGYFILRQYKSVSERDPKSFGWCFYLSIIALVFAYLLPPFIAIPLISVNLILLLVILVPPKVRALWYNVFLEEMAPRRSGKWWIAFLFVAGLTMITIAILIGLALSGNSGLGLQVVTGTIIVGFAIALTVRLTRKKMETKILSRRTGIIWLTVICLAIFGAIFPWLYFIDVEQIIELWQVIVVGGVVVAVIPILMIEAYPRLKEHGPPGMLTIAGLIIVFSIAYMTVISSWIVPYNPFQLDVGSNREPPSLDFPLGTTSVGQDMLSRVLAGGAIMFQVAIISVVVCFTIGVPIGLIASYRGGLLDRTVSLVMDSIFAFPGLVLAIAIAAMLGPGAVNMAISIAVVYVPSYFRVIRSQVLTVRELPYVEAAIVMGARDRDILFRYILPNVLPSAVVIMSINFADAILTAAGLTFVGLGLGVDVADWGRDLTEGRNDMFIGAWWVGTFPGVMIVLLALGFTLAGEGLNEILTPRLTE